MLDRLDRVFRLSPFAFFLCQEFSNGKGQCTVCITVECLAANALTSTLERQTLHLLLLFMHEATRTTILAWAKH
jgi:hypothetical protein